MEFVSSEELSDQTDTRDPRKVTFAPGDAVEIATHIHAVPMRGANLHEVPVLAMYSRVLRTVKCPCMS